MSKATFLVVLAVILFGREMVEPLITLRGVLEGGTELDDDL